RSPERSFGPFERREERFRIRKVQEDVVRPARDELGVPEAAARRDRDRARAVRVADSHVPWRVADHDRLVRLEPPRLRAGALESDREEIGPLRRVVSVGAEGEEAPEVEALELAPRSGLY